MEKISIVKGQASRLTSSEEDCQLQREILEFIEKSEKSTLEVQKITEHKLDQLREKVANFFCEDPVQFKLEECFRIFVSFVQRFKVAVDENRKRMENIEKIKARQQKCGVESASPDKTVMSRSCELKNSLALAETGSKDVSKVKRSRPSSQEISDVHSNLVEFLTCPESVEATVNLDGNVFGTNFRRVGSGRRSLRSVPLPVAEQRERSVSNESGSSGESFNRFSPLRRTLNYRREAKKEPLESPKPEICPLADQKEPEKVSPDSPKAGTQITRPTANFCLDLRKKNPSQHFVQHLTAIISPSKFVASNDSLHREFGSQDPSLKDSNIIISTITKASHIPVLPPIQRRSSSFTMEGKSPPPNAAIVIPLQKITEMSVDSLPEYSEFAKSQICKPEVGGKTKSKCSARSVSKSGTGRVVATVQTTASRTKSTVVLQRQHSLRSGRITTSTVKCSSSPVVQRSRSYYRSPSTISRTNLTSDPGTVQSYRRSSVLLGPGEEKPSEIASPGRAKYSVKPSFMKPTSASAARSRISPPVVGYTSTN